MLAHVWLHAVLDPVAPRNAGCSLAVHGMHRALCASLRGGWEVLIGLWWEWRYGGVSTYVS